MKQGLQIPQLQLNFRQWRRKGFAVFASIGKQVRIAVLKLSVSDRLTSKDERSPLWICDSFRVIDADALMTEQIDELILCDETLTLMLAPDANFDGACGFASLELYNILMPC